MPQREVEKEEAEEVSHPLAMRRWETVTIAQVICEGHFVGDARRTGRTGGYSRFGRSSWTIRFNTQLKASQSICPAHISKNTSSRVHTVNTAYAGYRTKQRDRFNTRVNCQDDEENSRSTEWGST